MQNLSLTTKYIVITVQCNDKRELRISFEIRKKKHIKVGKFVKKMKKMHEEAKVVLRKL